MDTLLTANIAAASPRQRRRSNINKDAVHDHWVPDRMEMAPAQLYATESGRLFHSGKIAICTVGLPARGKTHISVALTRYLRWLGVKTHAFHLGDYRRAAMPKGQDVPDDYFWVNASPSSVLLRQEILRKCRNDLYHFMDVEHGQVAIYDAVNPTAAGRRQLAKEFARKNIQTIFIESACYDQRIIEENVRNVKISSPDYSGWDDKEAIQDYLKRINEKIPHFETMNERELNYVKMINAGEQIVVNNCRFGYLPNRIVFYLMNLHIKSRKTYFARAGTALNEDNFKADASLSDEGIEYSKRLALALLAYRKQEHEEIKRKTGGDTPMRPLTVWTSTRRKTVETGHQFEMMGYKCRQRSQMSQLNPGAVDSLSLKDIEEQYPGETEAHNDDPYHHRYSRSESYHDLAVRLEPIILELEREQNDLVIIAHESVLRVLYGYLMACSVTDIPFLQFPRNEIVEIIPASYNNEAKRIRIPDPQSDSK